ncbi:fibrinogen-like protein 1 isoform X1 [Diabrotica virgifera virgifera]|uniref:Fibrinogen-like protein 1 isoform X1 n=1 Tax=Diabrotica virgifera virgifera TaxID=50390 RepID=A0A6P7FW75_DIAVI|nr:fibrinogen-like protein 1 isoform X1 [Diabrotica virgifera virgifera]
MISWVALLLICAKFAVGFHSPAEEVPAADPNNVKFRKCVDFTAEGGANSWKQDLKTFLYPENEAFDLGTKKDNDKFRMMSLAVVDKLNSLQEYANTVKNVSDKLNSLQEYENTLKNVSDRLNSLQQYENTLKNVLDKLNSLQEYENTLKPVFDKLNSLQEYENTLKHTFDKLSNVQEYQKKVFDKCKYLVGKSQIPFCGLNPEQPFSETEHAYPSSCKEILKGGKNKSGVYIIKPKRSGKSVAVLCDMETKGGGWTHIQKRFDGSQEFYLPWGDYKFGFGDLMGEFWIGLENIHLMTAFESSELLVELTDTDKKNYYAQYSSFSIGNEKDGYILNKIGGFSGDAGNSLIGHYNQKFTTFDVDQDQDSDGNCAQKREGAWWYNNCIDSNLNGKFMTEEKYSLRGLIWYSLKKYENLAGSRMMIRPFGE